MLRFYLNLLLTLGMLAVGAHSARGQREIGFIEKFALAEDRRQVLGELIPDTEEYFYYHCLHYQIQGQLPEAQAILEAWRAKLGDVASVRNMQARQRLLNYGENPRQTLDFLRDELGLQLKHAPPARDRAAALPNALDNRQLDI
ncbi:MAG: hypothetical protein KDA45_06475, partial [Planctomycetales bacterium]|nr:hypothetical protein [Planctomycetales bacterium]